MYFSRTPDWDFCFLPMCDNYISHAPAPGKDKKTAKRWPHVDPLRHFNAKMTSPCRNSAYSGFSGSFLKFFSNLNEVFSGEQKKKNPLFVWGWDRKIRPSQLVIFITWQAL